MDLGPVAAKTFTLLIQKKTSGSVITLSARAEDDMGNIGVSGEVEITVLPDYPPTIEITSIQNALFPNGSLHDPHNQQALGGIRVLEDSDVVVNFTATDQASLEQVICYMDDVPIETKACPGSKNLSSSMSFRIPRGTHGFPYRISVKAVDAIGQTAEDEL